MPITEEGRIYNRPRGRISEIEKIRNAGIKTVTLGKRILRTETAGEAVLAMIMYEIGDIND